MLHRAAGRLHFSSLTLHRRRLSYQSNAADLEKLRASQVAFALGERYKDPGIHAAALIDRVAVRLRYLTAGHRTAHRGGQGPCYRLLGAGIAFLGSCHGLISAELLQGVHAGWLRRNATFRPLLPVR